MSVGVGALDLEGDVALRLGTFIAQKCLALHNNIARAQGRSLAIHYRQRVQSLGVLTVASKMRARL